MTVLPDTVRRAVAEALSEAQGHDVSMGSTSAIAGGCINPAARLETSIGAYFLKWNDETGGGHFVREADGLEALRASGRAPGRVPPGQAPGRASGVLRVPVVIATADPAAPVGWLLLEFIERGQETSSYWTRLGLGLARLHERSAGSEHGGSDNLIGPLPQANEACIDWPTFWWERRLAPQLENAKSAGHLAGLDDDFERLRATLPDLLGPAAEEGYSVLHGDLWSGNVFPDLQGQPVLVDPAVYRGHREVDLAMTELFGGFSRGFHDAYYEAWPLLHGYETGRRDVYQLYPLLVHVNLFGASYEAGVRRALRRTHQ